MTWNFSTAPSDYPLVEDGDEQATRQHCRPPRRHAAARWAPVSVRHVDGGLAVRSRPRRRDNLRRRHGGTIAFILAATLLAACVTALLGTRPGTSAPTGSCPARTSAVVTSAGHTLRVRVEPGRATLIHLCAARSTGPIREWRVTIQPAGTAPRNEEPSSGTTTAHSLAGDTTTAPPLGVLRVGDRLALATANLTRGEHVRLTVDAYLESGVTLSFATLLAAPSMHP